MCQVQEGRDAKQKSRSRPPTYRQEEIDAISAHSDEFERAVFGTLLLTGLRKRELYFLMWPDIDFRDGVLRLTGDGKVVLRSLGSFGSTPRQEHT